LFSLFHLIDPLDKAGLGSPLLLLYILITGIISYFIIGVLIGWVYGNIMRRKNSVNCKETYSSIQYSSQNI
jgi:hypothetical protein